MLKEFRSEILIGGAKDLFDNAMDEGGVDINDPEEEAFNLTISNFIEGITEEKYPATNIRTCDFTKSCNLVAQFW